ncbi:response regulator [Sphingomonas sp. ZT3P38]|uniref:response regulator transcription factor n=1 Tax=Parasphingomonas zepuensis TaxID=3096161 RepID=UPI002FC73AAA
MPKPLIAIVEDDESLRHALVGLMRSLGYDGAGFVSAEEFLTDPALDRADCLVTDLQLPGISGFDLAAQLGEARARPLPVILVTARTERSIDERGEAAGLFCLLRKPFEADALVACIQRALDS